jgi:hypothetical protein
MWTSSNGFRDKGGQRTKGGHCACIQSCLELSNIFLVAGLFGKIKFWGPISTHCILGTVTASPNYLHITFRDLNEEYKEESIHQHCMNFFWVFLWDFFRQFIPFRNIMRLKITSKSFALKFELKWSLGDPLSKLRVAAVKIWAHFDLY